MGHVPNAALWLPYTRSHAPVSDSYNSKRHRRKKSIDSGKSLQEWEDVFQCVCVCAPVGQGVGAPELELFMCKPQGANTHQQTLPHTHQTSKNMNTLKKKKKKANNLASAQRCCQKYGIGPHAVPEERALLHRASETEMHGYT